MFRSNCLRREAEIRTALVKHIWNACLAIRNIKESTNSGLFLVKLTQDVEIEETAAEVISNVLAKGYFAAMAKQGASQDCERRPFKEKKNNLH